MLGSVIGSYRLVQKLGEGGMGAVYLGEHTLLGRRAAIKVLLPKLSAQPDVVNRFFNEARAVTTISDPGIVQVFDFGYHPDGKAFIVMELLEGEPLDRRLARLGRIPVHDALRLCRQVASSLAAAHERRIIHRDLKPENIFLVRDAEVASGERSKILDFGIAKLSDDHAGMVKTGTGAMMGTPTYMSPEQCRGLAELDHRSDIYALGCVLFHLIAGRPPFGGDGIGDLIAAHIREPAPALSSLLPEISPAVDALVLRCLGKAPADRYQTMTELSVAIDQLLADLRPLDVALRSASPYLVAATTIPPPIRKGQPPPTTLGASMGQLASFPARRRKLGGWLAGLTLLGVMGSSIALVATRDNASMPAPAALPAHDDAGAPRPSAGPRGAVDPDARLDAGSPSASPLDSGPLDPRPPDPGPPDALPADAGIEAPARRPHRPYAGTPRAGPRSVPSTCDHSVDIDCDGIPDVR